MSGELQKSSLKYFRLRMANIAKEPIRPNDGSVMTGTLRNTWTHRQEVVIAPLIAVNGPYVHRLQNTEKVRIYPLNRNNDVLTIEVLECGSVASVTVHCEQPPAHIVGAKNWKYDAPHLSIKVAAGDKIQVG